MIKTDLSEHILSKSTFMRGCQCCKSLWLHKHNPQLKEEISEQQKHIFQQGHDIGKLAQQLFPGGIDVSPESYYDFQQAVKHTAELIESEQQIIFEAAFQFAGILCAIDILVRKEDKWYAYEVKGATQVKPEYLFDIALQYYITKLAGLDLEVVNFILIDNTYVRKGELEITALFKIEDISIPVKELQPEIHNKIEVLKNVLKASTAPDITIGRQCSDPYPCDFRKYCWKDVPEDSVFDLKGRGASEASFGLYRSGIVAMDKIPADYPLGKHLQAQVSSFVNKESNIDQEGINEFLRGLKYPLYYLDFETYQVAVPEYEGTFPFQQIPFQYSLHIQRESGGTVEHMEFLADAGRDCREDFIKSLISNIGNEGSIIVYNQAFENRIMKEMAESFPQYYKQLFSFIDRLYDLMVPFRKKYYYTPEMKGSYSIKKVLPALLPELSYQNLSINNGADASTVFYNLRHETEPKKIANTRRNLLEYCGLDTYAMVKIIEKLQMQLRVP